MTDENPVAGTIAPEETDARTREDAERAEQEFQRQMAEQLFGGGGGPFGPGGDITRNIKVSLPRFEGVDRPGPVISVSITGNESDLEVNASVDAHGVGLTEVEYEACLTLLKELV